MESLYFLSEILRLAHFCSCAGWYVPVQKRVYTLKRSDKKDYRKVPKFSDTLKLCCNLPKIQTKRPNLRVFCQNDANGIANSEDPDQTAPLGAV